MESLLNALPEDVLRLILTLATPLAIRRCQQVCRLLRDLVKSDVHIQYLLELDACGYVEPANPRRDLTDVEKLELVRNHRKRWSKPESVIPNTVDVSGALTWAYTDGVYIQPVRDALFIRQLHFHQLPSPNRGVEHSHWVISDLGANTRDFAIDPEQNLLVLLEARIPQYDQGVYKLHLRSMLTGEPHSDTSPGQHILAYRHHTSLDRGAPVSFEICGRLLFAMFPSRSLYLPSRLIIWNWNAGTELLRVPVIGDSSASFALLSEDSFVIPNFSRDPEARKHLPDSSYGSLDVYQLSADDTNASSKPICVASFAMPLLQYGRTETIVRIRSTPIRVAAKPKAKVFDLAPGNRLLFLDVRVRSASLTSQNDLSNGTLCVPSSLLLNVLPNGQQSRSDVSHHIVVPWADWAEKTCWVNTDGFRDGNEGGSSIRKGLWVSGQRMAGFKENQREQIFVLDFDQHRSKPVNMPDILAEGEVHSLGERSSTSLDVVGETFCSGDTRAKGRYVEMSIPLGKHLIPPYLVAVDDEYLVLHKDVVPRGGSLMMYTF